MDRGKIDLRDYVDYFNCLEDEDLIEWYKMFDEYIKGFFETEKESTDTKKYMLLTDCGIIQFPEWTVFRIEKGTENEKKEEEN